MSLSESTPAGPDPKIWDAPLAPVPSTFVRARSRALRALAAQVLPRSIFFAHGARNTAHKRVALTFDDGPDRMTPRYLDVLDDLGVRATFFVVGEHCVRRAGAVTAYGRRGHQIGGHGWTHEPFSPMAPDRLRDELSRTDAIVPHLPGGRRLLRPPRGILSPRVLVTLASLGYATVLWSRDSDDCRTRDARVVARRLAPEHVVPGDVVLMHEMQPWTLEALPAVVGALQDSGFEFVTVTELINESVHAEA